MRYLLFLNRLGGISGGVERMVVNYANYLLQNDDLVFVVTIEEKSGQPFYSLNDKVKYFGLGKISMSQKSTLIQSIRRLQKLRSLLVSLSPDYILAFQFGPYKIASLSGLFLKSKVVLMERNSPQRHIFVSEGSFIVRNVWLLLAYRIAVQFPEYKYYYWRFLRPRIIVSRNFSNLKVNLVSRNSCKDIIFVGRYGYQKNTDLVFEVFTILAEHNPAMSLHMIGDNIVKSYNSNYDNLQLHEPMKNWFDLFQNSIVVLLSRFEGCPNVFLEAMSIGVPCFGLNGVDGIKSLLNQNRGFLSKKSSSIEIADDLFKYSQNLALQNEHRLNAFDYVKIFHKKSVAVSSFINELNG